MRRVRGAPRFRFIQAGEGAGNTADVREGLRTAQDRFTFDL